MILRGPKQKNMVWVFAKSCFIQHGIWESNMASWEISTWGFRAGRIIELMVFFSASHVCVRWLCSCIKSPWITINQPLVVYHYPVLFFLKKSWVDIHYLGGWWYWWRSFSPWGTKHNHHWISMKRCFINGILGIITAKKPSYICDCL